MYSLKSLLDMIATEAAEAQMEYRNSQPRPKSELPSMVYPLHIVRKPDGTLDWAE